MEAMEVAATTVEEVEDIMVALEDIMGVVEGIMVAVRATVEVTHLYAHSGILYVMMNQSSLMRRKSCALNKSPQVVEEADLQLDGGKVSRVEEVRNFNTHLVYS